MRVYYRGPDAVVTSEHFVWQAGETQVFVVRELRSVRRTVRRVGFLRKQWEICADVGGDEVTLYATRDQRIYNMVTRALRRALEEAGRHDGRPA